MIIGALWIALQAGAPLQEKVSLYEAIAVAQHFCRIAGVDRSFSLAEASGNSRGRYDVANGKPTYMVGFRKPGKKPTLHVHVDATSGDVVQASDFEARRPTWGIDKEKGAALLAKLGRQKEFRYVDSARQFYGMVNGTRIVNLNGGSIAHMGYSAGTMAYIEIPGRLPPPPTGTSSMSKQAAIALVKKNDEKTFDPSPMKKSYEAELGYFYDEELKKSKWVWEVRTFNSYNGQRNFSTREYVIDKARDYKLDRQIQSSSFRYQSRAPRVGLKGVQNLSPSIPLLAMAKQRLREFGRPDLVIDSFEIDQGIRLNFGGNDFLEIGPTGQTLFFRAHSDRSTLSRAVLLERGKKFILKEMPKLPEGKYLLGETGAGGGNTIEYRQWALGYPYSGTVVEVAIGSLGVCRFQRFGVAARPVAIPSSILSKSQIEQAVLRITEPKLPKNTPNHRYFMSVRPLRLAWLTQNPRIAPTLAWEVSVMRMVEIKNYSTRGGGSNYWFDAVTGKSIGRAP